MSNERGYTLAEMLVVCAIVGLVMASLLGLVVSGQKAFWYGTTQVDAQQTARVAIERMVKEIREAGYYPQNPDTSPVTCTASGPCYTFDAIASGPTASSVTLQYDWNGDGASAASGKVNDPFQCATGTACRGERVIYSFSSGALTRQEIGVDASAQTIASGISSMAFTYMAEDGTVTSVPANIRIIGVTVTAQSANQGAYVTMSDRIRLRNR
ncbi:MAG TPA: prepilin-type N-terminal cleavage/methylation domain-containing protein [Methylomirabilota bacterium]|jgi:prepilin-type N-terminal cleavage/methylation domain-containing protein|nr:prepilin-type N-terminal cleavage/methylation domain-containing protein [Methylomirabilota bacterium]